MKTIFFVSFLWLCCVSFIDEPQQYFRCKKITVNGFLLAPERTNNQVSYNYQIKSSDKAHYKEFKTKELREAFLEGINIPVLVTFETNGHFVLEKIEINTNGNAWFNGRKITIDLLSTRKMKSTILFNSNDEECERTHNLTLSLNLKMGKSIEPYLKHDSVEAESDGVKISFFFYDKFSGISHKREITEYIIINKIPPVSH